MKRSRVMWASFATFGLILVASIALTGGMYFRQVRNAQDGTPSLSAPRFEQADYSNFKYGLNVNITYVKFEPGDGLQVSIDFDPFNQLASDTSLGPTVPVCMIGTINGFNTNFSANQLMKTISTPIPLSGDINLYPFDTYVALAALVVQAGPNCDEPVAIRPSVFGSVQGFGIAAVADTTAGDDPTPPSPGDGVILIGFTARRTDVSRAFAVLIFIVMWLLTASVVITTAWYWITGRRVDLPFIALGTAILFALPNIRNAQPGILPRAGIISDLVGYIWNLLLVSLSVVSLVINWIARKDGKKKKTPVVKV